MELPDLEGQPPWVVVIVCFLFVAGTLGGIYLRRRFRSHEDSPQVEDEAATLSLPAGGQSASFDPVKEAMGMAMAAAARSTEDADRAEEEARMLARQLADCERDKAVTEERLRSLEAQCNRLQAQLDACRERNGGMRA